MPKARAVLFDATFVFPALFLLKLHNCDIKSTPRPNSTTDTLWSKFISCASPLPTIDDPLLQHGAIIQNTHVVYTSGRHGGAYLNKDVIYSHTTAVSICCTWIAEHFKEWATLLLLWLSAVSHRSVTAYHLTHATSQPVLAVYPEIQADASFAFVRVYDRLLCATRVLIVEDILTTGVGQRSGQRSSPLRR